MTHPKPDVEALLQELAALRQKVEDQGKRLKEITASTERMAKRVAERKQRRSDRARDVR
jgi:cell division septum initiation protein DivIVA